MTARPVFRILARAAVLTACLGAAGCTTAYQMKVDTTSAPPEARIEAIRRAPSGDLQSYQLRDKSGGKDADSLRAQETVAMVRAALNGRGLFEAASLPTADMMIDVEYGMDKPKTHMEEMMVPIYAQNGGGVIYGPRQVTSPTGSSTTRTLPSLAPPGTQLVGYEPILVPVTTYEKFIRLSAREARAAREGAAAGDLWSVSISSEDESNDLRKYLPLLASALVGYVGADTSVQRTIKLSPKDPTISLVKQGP
ncbi:MAG: hypothetical protein RL324_1443 [Verrucomicrobiota bacterium]|jgi:hypothetical protein